MLKICTFAIVLYNYIMEIEGTIIMDLPLQEGIAKSTGNPWKKKEWVLETAGAYPRKVKFHVFGERRVAELNFEIGKAYRISIDIESRDFNGRWYTDVSAYAATPLDAVPGMGMAAAPAPSTASAAPFGQPAAPAAPMEDPFSGGNDVDDLPF